MTPAMTPNMMFQNNLLNRLRPVGPPMRSPGFVGNTMLQPGAPGAPMPPTMQPPTIAPHPYGGGMMPPQIAPGGVMTAPPPAPVTTPPMWPPQQQPPVAAPPNQMLPPGGQMPPQFQNAMAARLAAYGRPGMVSAQ